MCCVQIISYPHDQMCFKQSAIPEKLLVCVSQHVPSTSVDTAIRASSCTPPEPAVLWNILSRDAITTSEICRAS